MLGYRIKIELDDNDTFLVTCPALPELTTFGDNEGEAALHAFGAIEEALAAQISEGREIPQLETEAGEGGLFVPWPTEPKTAD